MAIFIKGGGGGGGGVALDGSYADPDQLGSGKSGTAPGQAKQRLAADQTWSDPLEHFAESWDETYKVSALTGREDPDDAEANVDIALRAKGTGAIQADVTDNTTTGGNSRGNYAVDWQRGVRGNADQVASGNYSFIGSGGRNKASGLRSAVVGGYNNAATNSSDFIGGGANSTASGGNATIGGGSANIASGASSTVGGGASNTASNSNATVAGGTNNSAGSTGSFVGGGSGNVVSAGAYAMVLGGITNTAIGYSSAAWGNRAYASLYGQSATASGRFSADGDAQQSWLTMRNSTTDATQTELFLDGTDDRITVPSGSRFRFRVDIICTNETDGTGNAYEIKGAIKNIAGTTSLIGTNVSNEWEDDAGFAAVVEADDTNDALVVKVTGAASKTCRWVASVHLVQVT